MLFSPPRNRSRPVIPLQLLYAGILFVNLFPVAKEAMACGALPAGKATASGAPLP